MPTPNGTELAECRPPISRRKRVAIFITTMIVSAGLLFLASTLHVSADFWAKLFALYLVVGLPALSWLFLIRLRRKKAATRSRMKLYASLVFFECSLVASPAVDVAFAQGFDLDQLGFYFPGTFAFVRWTAALILGALVLLWVTAVFEARGWLPRQTPDTRLVPDTNSQRMVCLFLVAPSIGINQAFEFCAFFA